MTELAFLNGEFLPIENARVSIEDRGYQFGDAVYEYIASYDGKLFCLEEHLDRLERSMKALSFPAVSIDEVRQVVGELLKRSGLLRAGVYIQISRGVAPRNHPFPETATPQIIMTIRKVKEVPEKYKQRGAYAITIKDYRWGRCDIKTVQLLPNVMAKQQAMAAGAYDAIFVTDDDIVREATSSNLFIVQQEKLITHPLNHHILPGITRAVIIDLCKELKLTVEERFFKTDEMYAAGEVFLSGTTSEVLPLIRIDDKKISDGAVGPISKRLLKTLQNKGRGLV